MGDFTTDEHDDRVRCEQCARAVRATVRGHESLYCHAWYGQPDRNGERHPMQIQRNGPPLRCFFFKPLPSAADQRTGRDRWPCTEQEYKTAHRRRLGVWWAYLDEGKPKA